MGFVNAFTGTRGLGWKPNPPDGRDHDYDMQKLGFASSDLPLDGDLSRYVSRVLDQGNTSSCVAHMLAHAIDILQTRAGLGYDPMSIMYVYFHARRRHSKILVDDGTYIRLAIQAMREQGIPDDQYWPFKKVKINRRPSWHADAMSHQRRGGEYHHIFDTGDARSLAIKAAITEGYPVGFGTSIGEGFKSSNRLNIVDIPEKEDILGGHAVLCVGYKADPNFGTLYKVLNSWGDDYKENGYVWFTEQYMQWRSTRDLHILKGWEKIRRAA